VKAKRVKGLDPEGPLAENAARIVKVRLAELHSFAPAAFEPDNSKEQHDMRIAAKRLRYILEATDFCFGKPAQTARRRARDLQGLLGELHDCDVMLPRIEGHLAELRRGDADAVHQRAGQAPDLDPGLSARAPHRTSYRGLEMLAVHVEARRKVLFDRFCEYWAEQGRTGTWERLETAVERRLEEAKERRAAAERAEQAARELEEAERAEQEAADRARKAAAELYEARLDAHREPPAPPHQPEAEPQQGAEGQSTDPA
jgi:hypothetical protein